MTAAEAALAALRESDDFEDLDVDGTYAGPSADETTIVATRDGRMVLITVEEYR